MGHATEVDESLKMALLDLDIKQIHPADRFHVTMKFIETMLPGTRAYEHLVEQGYDDDEDYEGPPMELEWFGFKYPQ